MGLGLGQGQTFRRVAPAPPPATEATFLVQSPPGNDGLAYDDFAAVDPTQLATGLFGGFGVVGFVRFTGVTVPQGATISSAILRLQCSVAPTAAFTMTIRANDVDNAPQPTDAARPQTWATTTTANTVVPLSGSTTTGEKLYDVTAIVQEIVDRAGWASGNAIAFGLFHGALVFGAVIQFGNLGFSGAEADDPELRVTYT